MLVTLRTKDDDPNSLSFGRFVPYTSAYAYQKAFSLPLAEPGKRGYGGDFAARETGTRGGAASARRRGGGGLPKVHTIDGPIIQYFNGLAVQRWRISAHLARSVDSRKDSVSWGRRGPGPR